MPAARFNQGAMAQMDQYESNILRHIEEFGCSITSVFDPEERHPRFSYSIGISRSCGAPELIVVGLKPELGKWIVNEYYSRASKGEVFAPGVLYLGFLEGFAVKFVPVAREHREEYMRSTCWLHDGSDFEALQLIWPGTNGVWPYDPGASDWMRANQPILSGNDS